MNKVLKVVLLGPGPDDREAVVIKHYIDLVYPCYEKLKEKILIRFSHLRSAGNNLKFYWLDAEKDRVTIYNEDDFRMYLEHEERGSIYVNIIDETLASVKSTISATAVQGDAGATSEPIQTGSEELVHHSNVVCDGCEGPVLGFRYKCSQCVDFDLCMSCENKMIHRDHVMYRIPVPLAAPHRLARHMSKLHRRGHMLRSDAPNESCKRGRRPEYLEMLVNRCLAQDANISPETSAPVETSSAATNTSAHTEEAASHAAKAEKYAQVTADILGNFAKHFASLMDPFNVTDESLPPKAAEKKTAENETTPKPTAGARQENTEEATAATPFVAPTLENCSQTLGKPLCEASSYVTRPSVPENVSNSQATTATTSLNTSSVSESTPKSPAAAVPDWTLVDDKGNAADDDGTSLPSPPTGTTPKISPAASITSFASVPPTFAKLADDLQRHMDADLAAEQHAAAVSAQRSVATNIPEHLHDNIRSALTNMMNMGFSNEGGWLVQLLESVNGDISKALDMMQFNK